VRNQDVLISGAGVAGQALAIWLRRLGFTPVVVERAAAPRDGGQAVDLRGAAIEVARGRESWTRPGRRAPARAGCPT
jgi:2-polyprenyl-6-methoxyphenol hydroxylase-like FAD-dependent oxidoreductase